MSKVPWPQVFWIFDGVVYRWSGWFGCQLESMEWRTLPAGTKRILNFLYSDRFELTVFSTRREGFRVRTTWALPGHGTLDEHSARIRALRKALREIC